MPTKPAAMVARKLLKRKQAAPKGRGLEPTAVLKCTEKTSKAALAIHQRCSACHGRTVRDVLGSMTESGNRYTMADLRYDIKHGRLVMLAAGKSAGAIPAAKPRADAPLAGKPLPPASLDEFFRFLQGQLWMELQEHTGEQLPLPDKEAERMKPDVEAFVTPNLGNTERWVPYHTVLGVHELFLVQSVHSRKDWDERQRFVAMFVFRAHCKRDLFLKAQLPLMLTKAFWQCPKKAFLPGGPMERSILEYRRRTGQPLLTSCFRIIPPRVLKDDTENLVRSITNRTLALMDVAEAAWPVLKDRKRTAVQKVQQISKMITEAPGCGDTWAKMLTVCIDLAYPKERYLESQCDVGIGAAPPLRCLLPKGGSGNRIADLKALQKVVNGAKTFPAKSFWKTLGRAEATLRRKFNALPLVRAQASTRSHAMSAVTLQVQLCEYRQFRHSIARLKYGLPEDEAMRGEAESHSRLDPQNFVELDPKRKCVKFEFPKEDEKITFEVPLRLVGGDEMVAARVAAMCFERMRSGLSKPEVEKFLQELIAGYCGGQDVPRGSPAWSECRIALSQTNPVVSFHVEAKGGKRQPFQTTQIAAGGILEAERIARLCWTKLHAGEGKDAVVEFRNRCYKRSLAGLGQERPAKAQRK